MLTVVHDGQEANDEATAHRSLLDEIVRDGARQMLAAALKAEVAAYVEQFSGQLDENGHRLVVHNYDRRVDPDTGARQRFSWAILPAWARKPPQMSEVLPLPYLHGLSSGYFTAALEQFPGSGEGVVGLDDHTPYRAMARRSCSEKALMALHAARRKLNWLSGGQLLPVFG